ncbi:MAG TPA: FAD-binding oxidoreductase [Alphaproteobacteria bacterium]|nr:FAD-binding oxidoreductase [Alphaproteobacteria bacterium]
MQNIAVIGGGVIGASIAYHLARAGAKVTLLDQRPPVSGTTAASFAWLNGSSGKSEPYVRLRQDSLQTWRDLDQALAGALKIEWTGCISWRPTAEETERFVANRQAWGYPISLIERNRVAELEPGLIDPPPCAAHMPAEGALLPVEATQTLLAAAREAGADIRHETPVIGIDQQKGRVAAVEIPGERLAADCVVLAAGTETRALAALAGADIPMTSTPGVAFYCKPCPRLVNGVVVNEAFEMKQNAEGRFISVANFPENEPAPWAAVERVVRQELAAIARHVRGADKLEVDRTVLGYRPLPPDGFPMLGFAPGLDGLYVAVMHSGVTLAPIVGRFAVEEIVQGRAADALAMYRPGRFAPDTAPDRATFDRSF